MRQKAFFNWSSGKDSALAYYKAVKSDAYEISTLFTTVNKDNMRVSMHGVHIDLLRRQAESIGIPLEILELPSDVDMAKYSNMMLHFLKKLESAGIKTAIYGDILLEDIKNYRTEQLKKVNMEAAFPLWKTDTKDIMSEFIDLGFKAIITSVNAECLDESFVGREVDFDLLKDLPENVDVCGENGEFHTFVFDGPIFSRPIKITVGDKVYKEYKGYKKSEDNTIDEKPHGFWFCDLILKD